MSQMSHRLMVFTNAVEGKEDEYNDWYDNTHIREVLEIDGFVACQRFRADASANDAPASYLAVYEMETADPVGRFAALQGAVGEMTVSDALDRDSVKAWIYTAHGERVAV